jgi:hypothetical protein
MMKHSLILILAICAINPKKIRNLNNEKNVIKKADVIIMKDCDGDLKIYDDVFENFQNTFLEINGLKKELHEIDFDKNLLNKKIQFKEYESVFKHYFDSKKELDFPLPKFFKNIFPKFNSNEDNSFKNNNLNFKFQSFRNNYLS